MARWTSRIVAALVLLGASEWCVVPGARAEPLVTDRPDFTESTETVAPGRLQLEAGYTFTRRDEDIEHSVPEFLLRVGLQERLELRLTLNALAVDVVDADAQGFQDLTLGTKIKLVEGAADFDLIRPHIGLIVQTTLPTGLGEDEMQPEVILAFAWDLSDRFSLGSNLNYAYPSENGARFHQFSGSLVLGYQLTEKWGTYIEYFGFVPASLDGPNESFFDGGFTYLVNDDLQLDARAGVGAFNGRSPDYFVGVGVSWRFRAW
jgi:hypothetical protein